MAKKKAATKKKVTAKKAVAKKPDKTAELEKKLAEVEAERDEAIAVTLSLQKEVSNLQDQVGWWQRQPKDRRRG